VPIWIATALALLRGLSARSLAFVGGARGAATGATALALPDPFGGSLFGGGGDGGGDRARRRRRRRALTNSDRDDIAFIAATISKAAAGSFATQLVTRSR